jgi:uncharacterized protein
MAMKSSYRNLSALVAGILFGLGLAISQMADPNKVLGFLDVAGSWDPSLILVMAGAVGVTMIAFRWVLRRPAPLFDTTFHLPRVTRVDAPLIVGATIFGVGWGLAGYCPGPALASIATLGADPLVFVATLIAGVLLYRWMSERQT